MKNMQISLLALIFVLGAVPGRAGEGTPSPVADLVSAMPFTLQTPYAYDWRAERPMVSSGYLVVLRVDPQDVQPKQTAEPVLYVGSQTAERINHGHLSGYVVAIVPATVNPEDRDYVDLKESLLWFGAPQLPERVDAIEIEDQLDLARQSAITPLPPGNIDRALSEGGSLVALKDKRALLAQALNLLRKYSPEDVETIDRLSLSVSAN